MDLIGKKNWYFIFSALIIVPGIISLVLFGLKPSIDFTGGSRTEFRVSALREQSSEFRVEQIRDVYQEQGVEVNSVQTSGESTYLIKTKPISQEENQKVQKALAEKLGEVEEIRFETVGPTIGAETTQNALKALLFASILVVLYISWAFRSVPKPVSSIRFGICAIMALLHDVLIVVGAFSILGHFWGVEVDSLFVTALLTIIGFSVHDTIVVFDRIRENLRRMSGVPFARVVNESILQTLGRSLNTSLTVILVLTALLLFGGETIKWFVVALLIGIVSGTYSSIFNASPLLVVWHNFSTRHSGKRE